MTHEARSRRPEAVLIAGPTASGKSALALRLAQALGGRIINADSMQVYRDLRVLTARPTDADMRSAPHRLYGGVDASETYSVSRWLADARAELVRAQVDHVMPIFVGGTGLYFKALTQGLSEIPPVPVEVRTELRRWAAGREPKAMHAELARRDPLAAGRLRPTDPQRVLRALEVHAATGESLVTFQDRRGPAVIEADAALAVELKIDRQTLGERIGARAVGMFGPEGLAEVAALRDRGLDPALPAMRAIGVPQAMRFLAGDITIEAAIEDTTTASRQYVKRQETFFRHQLPDFRALNPATAEGVILEVCQS